MFRVLSEAQVRDLLDLPGAWKAVEDAYREFGLAAEVQSRPPVMTIAGPRPTLGRAAFGQYRLKGASLPNCGVAGAILYTRDYPYIYLWSTESDTPIALVACDWLMQYRVAVTAVFAIKALANPTINDIALFGAGKYATQTCRLIAEQWPSAGVHVVASSFASATQFASTMPANVQAAQDPRAVVENAEVIVTLTNAKASFLNAGWLRPGSLLLSMGGVHEVDIGVLHEADALIVDDLVYARGQGDLAAWISRGELSEAELGRHLRGNIGQIVAGLTIGRRHPGEKLLTILQGLTACDVVMAKTVFDRADLAGVGQTVEL